MVSRRGSVLLIMTCVWSWYGMMMVHELGHVLGALATGGRVTAVVLEFASFSRTDVHPNPSPLMVVWAGPLIGVILPLMAWLLGRAIWSDVAVLLRFFAGFCLIANGAYIGGGSFQRIGDAGDMVQAGSPIWTLWAFGLVCFAGGLTVWHGVGRRLGIARGSPPPNGELMACSAVLLVLSLVLVAVV